MVAHFSAMAGAIILGYCLDLVQGYPPGILSINELVGMVLAHSPRRHDHGLVAFSSMIEIIETRTTAGARFISLSSN